MDISEATIKDIVDNRPDLVEAIKSGESEGSIITSVKKDKDGRVIEWVEEQFDLDNNLLRKRVDQYVFYETGEINTITQNVYDEENSLISSKEIKHYTDGKQPTVTVGVSA